MSSPQRLAGCLVVSLLLAGGTSANDTLVTLGAGGLIPAKSSEIVMESESLEISVHQIRVKYQFRNTSDQDIDATVAFPLPALDGAALENEPMKLPTEKSLNFVSFRVEVDGKPVATHARVEAWKNGKDITARLKALGLPASLLSPRMKGAINKLTEDQRSQLEREDLLGANSDVGPGPDRKVISTEWWPWWEMHAEYFWQQRFPAHEVVEVTHSYAPVVGGSYVYAGDKGEMSVKPYCGDSSTLRRVEELRSKFPKRNGAELNLLERKIQYILTTANNWRGPIGTFKLTILTDGDNDVLATCMAGLKKTSPTRYEFQQANFKPERELDVLILQPDK